MIRLLLFFILLLFTPSITLALGPMLAGSSVGEVTPAETFLHENGFESSGDDSDWSSDGTACDYNSTGVTIERDDVMDCSAGDYSEITLSSDADDVYVSFAINWDTVGTADVLFLRIYDTADAIWGYVRLTATNHYMQVYVYDTSYSSAGTTAIGKQTTSYVMIRCEQGSGSDATLTAWVWNGSSWDQEATRDNGSRTTLIRTLRFINNYGGSENLYIDNVKEKGTIILDPTTDTP